MSTTTNLPVAAGKNLDLAVRELSVDVSAGGADSKADQDRIAAIKQDIDLADTTAVLQFGGNVQNTIAEFADSVLQTGTPSAGPGAGFYTRRNPPVPGRIT